LPADHESANVFANSHAVLVCRGSTLQTARGRTGGLPVGVYARSEHGVPTNFIYACESQVALVAVTREKLVNYRRCAAAASKFDAHACSRAQSHSIIRDIHSLRYGDGSIP